MSGKKRGELDWEATRVRLKRGQISEQGAEISAEERARILRRRAEVLARPVQEPNAGAERAVIVFRVGADRFALPLMELVEVLREPKIARVPRAPAEVTGLIQVRGEIRPVYDLRVLLGLSRERQTSTGFVLLLRRARGEFGLGVDEIEDVRAAKESPGRTAPAKGRAGWSTEDLVPVLAADSLL